MNYPHRQIFFIAIFPQHDVAEEGALRVTEDEACGFFFLWLLSFFLQKEKESNNNMDARAYDPETGSFLQSDPFNIATSQLPAPAQGIAAVAIGYEMQMLTNPHQFMSYGYVGMNPLRYNDPNGLIFGAIGNFLGGVGRAVGNFAVNTAQRFGNFVTGNGFNTNAQIAAVAAQKAAAEKAARELAAARRQSEAARIASHLKAEIFFPAFGGEYSLSGYGLMNVGDWKPAKVNLPWTAPFNLDFGYDYANEGVTQWQQGNYGTSTILFLDAASEFTYDSMLFRSLTPRAPSVSVGSNEVNALNFSRAAGQHMAESGRSVPVQILQEALKQEVFQTQGVRVL